MQSLAYSAASVAVVGGSRNRRAPMQLNRPSRSTIAKADDEAISGEWPVTIGLDSWEQCDLYYLDKVMKEDLMEVSMGTIMATEVVTVGLDDTVEEALAKLEPTPAYVEGAPVVDSDGVVKGVVTKPVLQDSKPTSKISEVILSVFATSKPSEDIAEVACTMLKTKDYIIPVVDDNMKLLGLVTRTDVFQTLEYQKSKQAQK